MHADAVPLSFAQRRLWFLNRVQGPNSTYNVPLSIRLSGPLDRRALTDALTDVVERHEPLRTVHPSTDGHPRQRVVPVADLPVLLETDDGDPHTARERLEQAARHHFDLETEAPTRGLLARTGPEEYTLLLTIHHIAVDGWSCPILLRDLGTAYKARLEGGAPDWEPLPVRYTDYTLWQRELLGRADDPGSLTAAQLDHWRRALDGLPEELALPYDRARPAEAGYRGGSVALDVDAELHGRLLALARSQRCTLFMVLQAALATTLTRFGAGHDIPVGTPTGGRGEDALDDLVGFFVNTLVLRTDTSGDPAFAELLGRVRRTCTDAYANQDVPFEYLVEELQPVRTLSRHPLFQTMLTLNGSTSGGYGFPGLDAHVATVGTGDAKFDLDLGFTEEFDGPDPAGLSGMLTYAVDLFDRTTAERVAAALTLVLAQVAADPGRSISSLDVMAPTEREDLLASGRGRPLDVPDTTVARLFERSAAMRPDAVALRCAGREWTYSELLSETDRLVTAIRARGDVAGELVGVCAERSADMVIALLAVLRAGAAYVPVDPAYPDERKRSMMAQVKAHTLVAQPGLDTSWHGGTTIPTDAPEDAGGLSGSDAGPRDLAYVIFTSGSSGRPKAVMVEHRTLVNYLAYCVDEYASNGTGGAPVFSSYAFDMLVPNIYVPLIMGQAVTVVPEDTDASRLGRALAEHAPYSFVKLTPGHLDLLSAQLTADQAAELCGTLVVGADTFPPRVLDSWRELDPGTPIINEYGPTEASVGNCVHPVTEAPASRSIPIGRPIANTTMYVLDDHLNPVPTGATGELYIGGDCVVPGYAGRPDLTAHRFVPDPFAADGSRMYRTGDVGRWSSDGALEFLGRRDEQLKVNGFRVEPGEVEAALVRDPSVSRAVVTAQSSGASGQRLVAHVVPAEGGTDTGRLRRFLAEQLPVYMVPSAFVVLDQLPLTSNGKLDRSALPPAGSTPGPGRPPLTDTERIVHRHFGDALSLPDPDVDSSFFELGGHSLLAAVLIGRLRGELGVEIGLRDLFRAPSIGGLARVIAGRVPTDGGVGAGLTPRHTLRGGGDPNAAPLFCVAPATGIGWAYAGLLAHLPPGIPVHVLQSPGLTEPDHVPNDLSELAGELVVKAREVQPEGPYQLAGWSLGGTLAHEMAVLLQERGEAVSLLTVVDGDPAVTRERLPRCSPDDPELLREFLRDAGADAPDGPLTHEDAYSALRAGNPLWSCLPREDLSRVLRTYARQTGLAGPDRVRVFRGDLALFLSDREAPAEVWRDQADGEVTVHRLPVGHHEVLLPASLERVGAVITERLRLVSQAASGERGTRAARDPASATRGPEMASLQNRSSAR